MMRSSKKPPSLKRAAPKKPQKEAFIAVARELGVDETGESFERAFRKLVPAKRPTRTK